MKFNLKSAKKLLKQYKEITETKLNNTFQALSGPYDQVEALKRLTNFGSSQCSLCQQANSIAGQWGLRCFHCVWGRDIDKLLNLNYVPCSHSGESRPTYLAIINATTARNLYEAIQDRIIILEKVIKEIEGVKNDLET